MDYNKEYTIVRVYGFGLCLNPLLWLSSVFSALWELFRVPSKILSILSITTKVSLALYKNPNYTVRQKIVANFLATCNVLFWMIPKIILYPLFRIFFCCMLIRFEIHSKLVDEDTQEAVVDFAESTPEDFEKATLEHIKTFGSKKPEKEQQEE